MKRGIAETARTAALREHDDLSLYAIVVDELLRTLHGMSTEMLEAEAAAEPTPADQPWDAAIAAAVEYTALRRGLEEPTWCDAPNWFLWTGSAAIGAPTSTEWAETLHGAPAAYIRHGVFPRPEAAEKATGDAWTPFRSEDASMSEARQATARAEEYLEAEGLRGHVYIDTNAVVRFATNTNGHRKLLGDGPVLEAFAKTTGSREAAADFLEQLSHTLRTRGDKTPLTARTWWDTPHLVVTGTPPAVALGAAAACIHEIPAKQLRWLTRITKGRSTQRFDEIARTLTGRPANSAARRHAAEILDEKPKTGRPGWSGRWIETARKALAEANDLRSILKRQRGPAIRWPLGPPVTCGALEADLATVDAPEEDFGRLWVQKATSRHAARLILLDPDDSEIDIELPDTAELAADLLAAEQHRRETPCEADGPWTPATHPGWSVIVGLAQYMAVEAASGDEKRTIEDPTVTDGQLYLTAENAPSTLLGMLAAARALSAETCEKCGAKGDPVADSRGKRAGCRCSGCRGKRTTVLPRNWPTRPAKTGESAENTEEKHGKKERYKRLEDPERYTHVTRLMRGDEDTGRGMWGWTNHPGWGGLIRAMLITLRPQQDDQPDNPRHHPFRMGTVKEKWGTLRVEETSRNNYQNGVIQFIEMMSRYCCIECGEPARMRHAGFVRPECDTCWNGANAEDHAHHAKLTADHPEQTESGFQGTVIGPSSYSSPFEINITVQHPHD